MKKFDRIIDSKIDVRRKWNKELIEQKFNTKINSDFIPLWIADMDFLHPKELKQDLIEYISKSNLGYTNLIPAFYNSIINWQKRRHGVDVKKEWIKIGYGTVSTLHLIYSNFVKDTECIMFSTPCYDPFYAAAKNNNKKVVFSKLIEKDNRYFLDYEDIEKKMKENKVKIYILCNPHNPSGRVWEKKEIEKIAEICLKNDVILVSDEVHSELILKNSHFSTLKLNKKYLNNLIFLTSPNKAFNLGGLKTSYAIIPNEKIAKKFELGMKKNSVTSPNILGLISLISSYDNCEYWLDELKEYINLNYNYTKEYIEKNMKDFKVMPLESSYLLWVKVSGKSAFWTEKFANEGVFVEDGEDFVSFGEKYIRINLGISKKYLKKSLDIMKRVYKENYGFVRKI